MTLTLNRQLLTSRQILVAFSGGLDSTVLLHQLVQWRTENPGVTLRAIHVHHGLSANADAWVTHCENVCQQWQVPLVVERVQLAQEGLGPSAAGALSGICPYPIARRSAGHRATSRRSM